MPVIVAAASVLVVLGMLASGYWLWAHPKVAFTNSLPIPLLVKFGDAEPQRVAARQQIAVRVPRSAASATWRVSEDVFGATTHVSNTETLRLSSNPFAVTTLSATNEFDGQRFFIPLVTNDTSSPLRITGNSGVENDGQLLAQECDCTVAPGEVRQPAGMYPLISGSTLLATDRDGKRAMFERFAASVNPTTGEVGLRFKSGNFRLVLSGDDIPD